MTLHNGSSRVRMKFSCLFVVGWMNVPTRLSFCLLVWSSFTSKSLLDDLRALPRASDRSHAREKPVRLVVFENVAITDSLSPDLRILPRAIISFSSSLIFIPVQIISVLLLMV